MAKIAQARAGWYIKPNELEKALNFLGIDLPVKIRFTSGKYRVGACYPRRDHFVITINQNRDKEYSLITLWHELIHAKQMSEYKRQTGQSINTWYEYVYKPADGNWGNSYQGNKLEIEAREKSEEYAKTRDSLLG